MPSNTMKYVAIAGLVSVALLGGAYALALHDREQQTPLMKQQAAELQKMKKAEQEAAITAALARHMEENPDAAAAVETETAKIKRVPGLADSSAKQSERLEKMLAYRGDTPIVADFCWTRPVWPVSEEDTHEMTCHLTGFRNRAEIYTAGWKVVSSEPDSMDNALVKLVYIERIGGSQWKGGYTSLNEHKRVKQ